MNTLLINYVAYYATQVRAQLADLSLEVIEDLTDGLEADLMDAMQESRGGDPSTDLTLNDLIDRFGQPKTYAHELRTAAGFEPQQSSGGTVKAQRVPLRKQFTKLITRMWQAFFAVLSKQPWWNGFRDFMVTLRPLWWVWRALLIYAFIMFLGGNSAWAWVPLSFAGWMFFLVLAVVSIQIGRRSVSGKQLRREPLVVKTFNIILLILLLPLTTNILVWAGGEEPGSYSSGVNDGWHEARAEVRKGLPPVAEVMETDFDPTMVGLIAGGQPVSNLFVYDAEGNPLPRVQIVNQDGRPVTVSKGQAELNLVDGTARVWLPSVDEYGRAVGNAFPVVSWALDQKTEYCTPEDEQIWNALLQDEFMNEDGKFFSYQDGSVIGEVVGHSMVGEEPFVWGTSFTSSKLSAGDGCVMGVKVPAGLADSAIFPAERIAPLGAVLGAPDIDDANSPDSGTGATDPSEAPQGEQATKDEGEQETDESKAQDSKPAESDEKPVEKTRQPEGETK